MTTARDLVMGYVNALDSAGEAMRAAFPPLERLADVLGLVRSHRISRSGEVGTCSYSVHGAGCLFINQDGSEIDVDFTADGAEIFDLWRLRLYGQSLPAPFDLTEHDLRSALESLKPLLVEVRPGWFSVGGAKASA
ncbi:MULTISPECIES: DUF6896 domain-containing protein [unclassified Streptomyces]|uniref:DUF6896 domain-containing protein n=1 Tax=unclassified Streptomyces TaxID=2593676 RepID=UPI00382DDDF6